MKIYNQYQDEDTLGERTDFIESINNNLSQLCYALKSADKIWGASKEYLYEKPWYLILGPVGSGKTSLLRAADIHFSQVLAQEHQYCSSWISENAVFIDIQGKAVSDQTLINQWREVYQCFRQVRRKLPINGIILTLNLSDIINSAKLQREALLHDYLTIIKQFSKSSKLTIPIYITITHLDHVNGFSSFFDGFSLEDREQSCGFMIPEKLNKDEFSSYINKKYDHLIKVLNQNVIKRLQQVANRTKRATVNEFPLQLESIKDTIIEVLKLLSINEAKPRHVVRGLFLTSCHQAGIPYDRLAKPFSQTFSMNFPAPINQEVHNRSFFISQLLSNTIPSDKKFSDAKYKANKHQTFYRYSGYAGIAAATTLTFAILAKGFIAEVKTVNYAGNALLQYHHIQKLQQRQNLSAEKLASLIISLNTLAMAERKINDNHFTHFSMYPFSRSQSIRRELNITLRNGLKTQLLPELAAYLAKHLAKQSKADPRNFYSALKAYLMLGYPEHMQASYFSKWLDSAWSEDEAFKDTRVHTLTEAIEQLFQNKLPPIDMDIDLVRDSRASLNQLPKSFVAYIALKNDDTHQDIIIDDPIIRYKNNRISIPYIYTKTGFLSLYDSGIRQIANNILQGDWVLGKQNLFQSTRSPESITQELQKLYVADYINWWNSFLANVNTPAFQTMADAAQFYDALSQKESSLDNLFRIIHENTAAGTTKSAGAYVFNQEIASQFYNLDAISSRSFDNIKMAFKEMANNFNRMQSAAEPDQVAFAITKKYFLNSDPNEPINTLIQQIKVLPYPASAWLTNIVNNTWIMIAVRSQNYINQKWISDVIPEYKANISNKYPLVSDAESDIELKDFSHFFNSRGTLNRYFETYIQPFVNMDSANWTAKNINGLKMNLPDNIMDQFIRGNLIRKMFFANNSSQLNVGFSLTPVTFQPIVKDMVIDINGNKVMNYQGSSKVSNFIWPGKDSTDNVEITIQNVSGDASTVKELGPWAWFRILDKSNIKTMGDTQHFELIFSLDGSATKYTLVAKDPINPFVPGVINQFNLPDIIG